jgi:hypothetical protein
MKEADLMENANSEMVQHLAAAKILDILAPPEAVQTELQMKQRETEETNELKKAMADLAKAQKTALEGGRSLKDVAESTIVEGEVTEVKD